MIDSLVPVEPLAGTLVRNAALANRSPDPAELVEHWQSRTPGDPRTHMRYRWELTHRIGVPMPAYAGPETTWRAWRPKEQRRLDHKPFDFEAALVTPMIITENVELLCELESTDHACAELAGELRREAASVLRRDFARHVQMTEPWEDTFALWCLVRQPSTLALLHPVAVAIAAVHAAGLEGPILGTRFPYANVPLCSASAHLATSLLTLGSDLELVASLGDFVREQRTETGGWTDGDAPADPLTTLVCADLLGGIDPSFEGERTIAFFESAQGDDGLWRALGPDAPWLTVQILSLLRAMRRPFAERFRWPHRAETMRDHKTRIPFFAYFAELAQLFATLPGLARERVEIAFIDLIGFRTFNNRHGQDAGDEVLRAFAAELERIPTTRAIRDGGDEFLVVGAPSGTGLVASMRAFQKEWPGRFRSAFGADVPPVTSRILVANTAGGTLRHAREELGRRIGLLKDDPRNSSPEGILDDAGPL